MSKILQTILQQKFRYLEQKSAVNCSIDYYDFRRYSRFPVTFVTVFCPIDDCSQAPLEDWSEWSICAHDGATCGFRWGRQTRYREGSQHGRTPNEATLSLCPPSHSQTQRCRMKKKCPTGEDRFSWYESNNNPSLALMIISCCMKLTANICRRL